MSIAILAGSVVATMLVASTYLERVHGWDRPTARFSSVPGALTSVLVLAATSKADLPRVAVAQSVRLFTLVALMPSLIRLWGGDPRRPSARTRQRHRTGGRGHARRQRSRWPPPGLAAGPGRGAAGRHGGQCRPARHRPLAGRQPAAIADGDGFVATGAVIGAAFAAPGSRSCATPCPARFVRVLLALVLSAGFAAVGPALLGLPFGQLWLAFAPGGVEAMAVMALALELDPAFVGAHHVLRILGLNMTSPVWGRSPRPPPGA